MVEGQDLVGDGGADLFDQLRVPGGAEGDDLREDGGLAEPREPVEGLGPGLEGAHAEPFDRPVVLVQEADLLVEGQPGEEVADAPRGSARGRGKRDAGRS
nr:hypothetical protein GCM10025732_48760 [Glycomyces mayteni]